ncbi:MAG: glucose 1-dehydrogenase [Leptospira sp.]|nr:glucose 1-dehydrogenase [Leptospira sp.]NCS94718.1 glucose 1-dehydrogenase [Leptospira sp.]
MGKLTNKTAVVTGGNSGIGFFTAKDFINEGAKVLITGRKSEAVNEAIKKLGNQTEGIVSDQSSLKDIDNLVMKTKEKLGSVDILFINAGVAAFAPLEGITEESFDTIMNINFKGALFTLQKFLPLLKDGSNVIFLSSVNAYTGMPNTTVYAASKAAMNSLSRTAAQELAGRNIRVNAVCPGPVETPIFGKMGLPEEVMQEFGKNMQARVPLKRFGKADEIAKLVTFLASDDAKYITGAEYVIDGGINILN